MHYRHEIYEFLEYFQYFANVNQSHCIDLESFLNLSSRQITAEYWISLTEKGNLGYKLQFCLTKLIRKLHLKSVLISILF